MIEIGPYTFTVNDALRTFANLGELWDAQVHGRTSDTTSALGDALATRLSAALGEPNETVTAADLRRLGMLAMSQLKQSTLLDPMLADVWLTLRSASDALRQAGQMPPTRSGAVVQVSSSAGGVPKTAVDAADVDFGGVIGDVQRVRMHHGRPWQALCLYSDEVVEMLQAEGHPIGRGSVGENITVRGLDWEQVRPGVVLQIGDVLAHVQAFAEPCSSNTGFFLGGDFQRMNISRGPVSRVYATVIRPGRVTNGDTVVLEPSGLGDIETMTAQALRT